MYAWLRVGRRREQANALAASAPAGASKCNGGTAAAHAKRVEVPVLSDIQGESAQACDLDIHPSRHGLKTMGDGIGLAHHRLYEAAFLRGVEEPLLIFEGRIAVELDIHVKADRSTYVGVASRLRALPFATAIDLQTVDWDAHASCERANLGHETAGEAGGEIGDRQWRGAVATVKPVFV